MGAPAAFFDIDRATLTQRCLIDFLRFWKSRRASEGGALEATLGTIRAEAGRGVDPVAINRLYYQQLAGESYAQLCEAGRVWFAQHRRQRGMFVGSTLSEMTCHRLRGDTVVLVSESFGPCLAPIARELAADVVLCSDPLVDDLGLITGEVPQPLVGAARAAAVRRTVDALRADAAVCSAYGSHSGDLDMLRSVGRPHVVGDDPVLAVAAQQHGWPVLCRASTSTRALSVPSLSKVS